MEEGTPMNTEVSDFNLWHISDYGRNTFLVAGRIYDLAPDRWEKLTCIWYGRHGMVELADDRYIEENRLRYKTVDALVAEVDPSMSPVAKFIYDEWVEKKAAIAKRRAEKPVVILPPPPKPPSEPPKTPTRPIPKPEPTPVKPKPKKGFPLKTIVVLLGAVGFALKFLPVPPVVLLAIEWITKILQAIAQ
jgi:hypothetical protein